MKIIAILLLILIGVYLYKRTQRLANEEQEQKAQQEEAAKEALEAEVKDVTPTADSDVSTPSDEGVSFDKKLDIEGEVLEIMPEPEPEPKAGTTDLTWANAKLSKAVSDTAEATDTLAEYTAMSAAVAECYKQRKQSEYVAYGASLAEQYVSLFTRYLAEAKTNVKGIGLMHMSTLLNDNGEFDAAIAICNTAIKQGVSDGTVTGFEGRITRIEKAKAKANK